MSPSWLSQVVLVHQFSNRTVCTDPNFDPNKRVVCYARVIEIPTPCWIAYEVIRFKIKWSDNIPMIVHEQA
ncbi:DUF3604 domain-containing protein [Pseudomonadota bacterium]